MWVVKIVPAANPTADVPADFLPSVNGAQPNQPLGVQKGDSVIWRNNTDDTHWPWPLDSQGKPMTAEAAKAAKVLLSEKEIPPGDVSDPIFEVRPQDSNRRRIDYCCKHHEKEVTSIQW